MAGMSRWLGMVTGSPRVRRSVKVCLGRGRTRCWNRHAGKLTVTSSPHYRCLLPFIRINSVIDGLDHQCISTVYPIFLTQHFIYLHFVFVLIVAARYQMCSCCCSSIVSDGDIILMISRLAGPVNAKMVIH